MTREQAINRIALQLESLEGQALEDALDEIGANTVAEAVSSVRKLSLVSIKIFGRRIGAF